MPLLLGNPRRGPRFSRPSSSFERWTRVWQGGSRPISLSADHSNKLILAEAVGAITRGEIEQHLSEERRAGGISYREMIDATRATAAFDAADARSLIETVRVIVREIDFGPTAVIVADDMTYGMLRMLEVLLEGVCDVRPFRNAERNTAEQWVRTMPIRPRIKS